MLLAGIAPDYAANLVVGDDGMALDVFKLDLAAGDIDNDIIELVMMPRLLAAGRDLRASSFAWLRIACLSSGGGICCGRL